MELGLYFSSVTSWRGQGQVFLLSAGTLISYECQSGEFDAHAGPFFVRLATKGRI